ncbi:cardiolipin synthase [Lachnobacterium bovis]|uniref:cardiolipin synthase n=1 Tax=Lachnobacterium bovis TaxID=140626 RepID=UPI003B50C06E
MDLLKKLLSKIFGFLALTFFAIFIQLNWIIFWLYVLNEQYQYASIGIHVLAIIIAFVILNKKTQVYNKMSWMLFIVLMPILGCMCYFIYGRSELTKKTREKLSKTHNYYKNFLVVNEYEKELDKLKDNRNAHKIAQYMKNYGHYPIHQSDDIKYYEDINALFEEMITDIEKAEKYIFIEFFIVDKGYMLDRLLSVLEKKIKQGVEVRFIYDDVGCINTMKTKDWTRLAELGIKFGKFNKFKPIISVVMNNRDHRKNVVIDGKITYTGGFNLADEYINKIERFGHWKDAGVRFTGKPVINSTVMFLEMWNFIKDTLEDPTPYISYPKIDTKNAVDSYILPYADSPLDYETVGENIYLNLINNAKKYVYIFTPYLIIDPEMTKALTNTAKSGVDVRIVTPGIPDKKMIFLATQSSYEPLIEGGVKIYQYKPGFLHSKCCISDDKYGVVGTINFDFRSFYLHYESAVLMYKCSAIKQLKKDFIDTIAISDKVTLEFTKRKDYLIRFLQSILRAFAPLL